MASPTVTNVVTSTELGDTTSHGMSVPTGSGGVLVGCISCDREANVITFPSGDGTWTTLQDVDPARAARMKVAIKNDNSEAAIAITTGTSCESVMFCWRIAGSEDPDVTLPDSGQFDQSSANADPPNVSVTDGPKDILSLVMTGGDSGATTYSVFPSGYGSTDSTNTGGGATSTHGARAHLAISAASAENPGTFTSDTLDDLCVVTVLMRASGISALPSYHGANRGIMRGVGRGVG